MAAHHSLVPQAYRRVIVLYVATLSAGFLLGVYAMLYGVERGGAEPGELQMTPRRMRLSLPALAVAMTLFGATGYVMARWTSVVEPRRALVASAIALALAFLSVVLVRRWTRAPSTEHGDDPRFVLMGHLARVTETIGGQTEGAISYEINGARHAQRARSTDGSVLAAGSEAVIEKVEDGIAYVEAWSQVEQRL